MTTPSADAPRELLLTRVIAAPRALVWRCHTERDHLDRWWGPKGFATRTLALDVRPGGRFHYHMRTPDGKDWWGLWRFREVVAPERLHYVLSFCDAQATPMRHPMAPTWPLEMLATTTFAEQAGATLITHRLLPLGGDATGLATFAAGFEGMDKGFNATWDQLDAYLRSLG